MQKYGKPLGILAVFFLVSVSAAFINRNSETLYDYAQREPEIAYMTHGTEESMSGTAQTSENEAGISSETDNNQLTNETQSKDSETDLTEKENGRDTNMKKELRNSRITYQPDFYYEPLSEDLKKRITGMSWQEGCPVSLEDLCYVRVLYVNFKGNTSTGELICNRAIAQDLAEIFYGLYEADYQIEQIRLPDEYSADTLLSMQDNNTSCFHCDILPDTDNAYGHDMGLAIDINPFFNPTIVYNGEMQKIFPTGGESYADRDKPFAYKIDENDLCYKLFTEHGFTWGGNWNHQKSYSHFEKKTE